MNRPILLYNTLSRQKEIFQPLGPETGIYTCGPTVYNYQHIGNLRTYLFEDILKRVLRVNGFKVRHVMNITDVGHLTSDEDAGEDKMEKGAAREGKTVWEIAEFYSRIFFQDLEKMNIGKPDVICKATDHIPEQIALLQGLEAKGFTYTLEDGIYFDTAKFPAYGDFARVHAEELQEGSRVALVEGKRNATDFALWKFSPRDKKRQMEWESPWGTGFPGWHLECSAMSMKYLGETFDIHCGGVDHIPVHHPNEVAQSQALTGKPLARFWLHGGWLMNQDSKKMSKSSGEYLTLSLLEQKGFSPMQYRLFCLGAHYRAPLNFSWEALEGGRSSYERLRELVSGLQKSGDSRENQPVQEQLAGEFREHVNDDLNMPRALAVFWKTLREDSLGSRQRLQLLGEFDRIFGLGLLETKEETLPAGISALIEERARARSVKNWAEADRLRRQLAGLGIEVRDAKDSQVWKRTNSAPFPKTPDT